jgi:diadenosine tetraphosphate (Ap4A) HIT family hydrolase
MISCLFCKIIAHEIPSVIITENDHLLVIKDIHPQAPIHYLILPKEHITHIGTMSEKQTQQLAPLFLEMAQSLSRTVSQQEFKLKVNNGPIAGQEINHLHLHFLADFKKS